MLWEAVMPSKGVKKMMQNRKHGKEINEKRKAAKHAERIAMGLPAERTPEERMADAQKGLAAARMVSPASQIRRGASLEVQVIKDLTTMRHRVPGTASDPEAKLAGYALARMIDVLAGKVNSRKAPSVL